MASQAQLEANQRNAQFSTGPASEEAKARSSQKACKHGFNSAELFLPDELREEFEDMRDSLRTALNPREVFSSGDPFGPGAGHQLQQLLLRYHAHFHRIYHRTLKALKELQSSLRALIYACPKHRWEVASRPPDPPPTQRPLSPLRLASQVQDPPRRPYPSR